MSIDEYKDTTCLKGCCKVGAIIYEENDLCVGEIIETNQELEQYEAFHRMFDSGTHPNYALPSYGVDI